MIKQLKIGKGFALPPDTVTSTLVVYGGKGMGKTVFGATLAEELAANQLRWSWLDPLGVAWGIRHSADGTGNGVECLILGGTHGDIPIEPGGGAAVADVVVEEHVNVVVDFSRKTTGEMWGIGEKVRFVNAYARRLFQRQGDTVNGHRREPLMQIVDEAARYIPQTIPAGNPDLAMCVAAFQQFVEEGRNVGLGVCMLTQRSARINKDVAELADAMIAFRTVGPRSLVAVLDWLGEHVAKARHKELAEQVRQLPRGSALIVSPGWLNAEAVVPIRMRHTFDSSATPKPGERAKTAKGEGAKPDLDKIRARMAETIERAKADHVPTLKARIAELEKAAVKGKAPAVASTPGRPLPELDEGAVLNVLEQLDARAGKLQGELSGLRTDLVYGRRALRTQLAEHRAAVGRAKKDAQRAAEQAVREARKAPKASTAPPEHQPAPPGPQPDTQGAGSPQPLERRIMTALAQLPGDGMTRDRLALMIGCHPQTKSFRSALIELRERGLLDDLTVTARGFAELGAFEALPTGAALLEWWCREKLSPADARVLRAIAVGTVASQVDLAAALGLHPQTKSLRNAMSKLRGLGLVEGFALSSDLR